MKKISKVLITGLGSIGQRHVRNIRKVYGKSVNIIAFRSRNTSPVINADMTVKDGKSIEKEYNILSYDSLDDALAERPNAIFITNPNSLHIPIAIKAANAGCHLYIEKELSNTWRGVDKLSKIVSTNNLVTFVAYQRRYHPGYKDMREILRSGELGNILSIHFNSGENIRDWHPYENYKKMHATMEELGGGSLLHQTHELNLLLWYFGLPKKIFALGGSLSKLKLDVEDSVDIILEFEKNNSRIPAHVHIDYLQRPARRVCEVIGDKSYLHFDFFTNELIMQSNTSGKINKFSYDNFCRDDMFLSAMEEFFYCVENERSTSQSLEEGINSMKISMAAKESLEKGNVIYIS